jgi:signal transduction histidine kinase
MAAGSNRADLPGPWAYIRLWLALAVLSLTVVVLPVPIGMSSRPLAIGIAAAYAAVGLGLLHIGLLRFGALGSLLDLFAGLGFGTLALANLTIRLLAPLAGDLRLELALALLLLTEALAASLFLAGLICPREPVASEQRRLLALAVLGVISLCLVFGGGVSLAIMGHLSGVLDSRTRALLAEGAPVYGFLAGRAVWLVLIDVGLALLFFVAALGYMRASWDLGGPNIAETAAALLLLSFGQVHAVVFPTEVTGYIGSSDVFRLAAYLVMLFSLVGRLGNEIADRAAREERLRLSRDIHDGLAQYLSLLNLRLNRATSPDRPADARARDLDAAKRLLEAALLEARQAINVLRTGRISWQELTCAVASFADEFAANHEVNVNVSAEGGLPPVDAELQVELLRVLQESFSNAVRHGRATCLEVAVSGTPRGLALTIRDNGSGFDLERTLISRGVGLDSMIERLQRRRGTFRIDSAKGQGATVSVWLPVAGQGRPSPAEWGRSIGRSAPRRAA